MNQPVSVSEHVKESTDLIVAFASLEGDMVDQHFGSSQGFFVYAVGQDHAELLVSKAFAKEKKDGNEDKLKPKLAWLVGCDIVYCGSIGGSATRQLVSLGVTPVQVKGGPDVDELIEQIQTQLRDGSEFWLTNLLQKKHKATQSSARFAEEEPEDWD